MPSVAQKHRYQRALYWAKTGMVNSEPLVAAPVELRVRWDWKRREIRAADSSTVALDASVVADRALVPGSPLWLAPGKVHEDGTALEQWHGAGTDPGWDIVQVVTADQVRSIRNRGQSYTAGLQRTRDYVPDGWHLLRIPDLKLWLHADHGLYTTSVGTNAADADADPVGRWVSLDENVREFKQATAANRPTLKTAIINGKQVLRFDGSNDALAAGSSITLEDDFTAYLAGQITGGQALQVTSTSSSLLSMTEGSLVLVIDEGGLVNVAATFSAGSVVGRFQRASNSVTFAPTGQSQVAVGTLTDSVILSTLPNNGLGGCDHRHALLFDRALTPPEQRIVEAYLKADLGVELP